MVLEWLAAVMSQAQGSQRTTKTIATVSASSLGASNASVLPVVGPCNLKTAVIAYKSHLNDKGAT